MKKMLILFYALVGLAPLAQAKLNVVATMTDFAAIAQEIGGDKVTVTTLAKDTEDPHFADARPSFVSLLFKADLLLEGGAELEIGWLPPLLNNARNSKILPGAPGNLRMATGVRLLDVPSGPIDRSMGDVHPAGNPHYYLDPANGKSWRRKSPRRSVSGTPPMRSSTGTICAASTHGWTRNSRNGQRSSRREGVGPGTDPFTNTFKLPAKLNTPRPSPRLATKPLQA
jgi:hypothetical protein